MAKTMIVFREPNSVWSAIFRRISSFVIVSLLLRVAFRFMILAFVKTFGQMVIILRLKRGFLLLLTLRINRACLLWWRITPRATPLDHRTDEHSTHRYTFTQARRARNPAIRACIYKKRQREGRLAWEKKERFVFPSSSSPRRSRGAHLSSAISVNRPRPSLRFYVPPDSPMYFILWRSFHAVRMSRASQPPEVAWFFVRTAHFLRIFVDFALYSRTFTFSFFLS